MTRRNFNAAALGSALPISHNLRKVDVDGVRFSWFHRDARLCCELSAPTQGWMAAGFNDKAELHGTQFVIADLGSLPPRVEWHRATPPSHHRLDELGGHSDLMVSAGRQESGYSVLDFSLPVQIPPPFALDLRAGAQVSLMIAWSLAREFDHHSAWHQHFQITL